MELRHLRYFDAVAETRNFTRAAERLHVTQSTLSHQIKQLEEELGAVLFDRSGRHVRMALLHPQFLTRKLLDDCFHQAGAKPLVVAQMNSVAPMIALIRQTDLAGIITETAVSPSPELRVIPLEDPTPIRTPGLLWPKGATRSPVLKHFAEIIRRAAGTVA